MRCGLHAGRTQVVFGEGDPDAELALVGEAPGLPRGPGGNAVRGACSGAAGAAPRRDRPRARRRLSRDRAQVQAAGEPRPAARRRSAACEPYLYRQLELVRPRVVASLGSFATALLSGRALGITRVHGQAQKVTLAGRRVTLYPLYHPAAALYTPTMLDVLDARRRPAAQPCSRARVVRASVRHTCRPRRRATARGAGRCSSGCSE